MGYDSQYNYLSILNGTNFSLIKNLSFAKPYPGGELALDNTNGKVYIFIRQAYLILIVNQNTWATDKTINLPSGDSLRDLSVDEANNKTYIATTNKIGWSAKT